jgi:hypothetical protein
MPDAMLEYTATEQINTGIARRLHCARDEQGPVTLQVRSR